jgi:uncharacterized protein (DUF1810 family)
MRAKAEKGRSTVAALERFRRAQDDPYSGFEAALAELRAGRKRGHWIWYVFPQIEGLGRSPMAHGFAIADLAEAIAYLNDPVLGERLLAVTEEVATCLDGDRSRTIHAVMGSEIDVLKLVSSLTLFREAAKQSAPKGESRISRFAAAADGVLAAAASAGYGPCQHTLARVATR